MCLRLAVVPAAVETPDHVLVPSWKYSNNIAGIAWHPVPMTRDACRRALLPELARLRADGVRTTHFSGGVPVLGDEDHAAVQTDRFSGVAFRATAQCRPIPR